MGRGVSGDSGFSLIEVLIAIPLTCVVVLNVASLFVLSMSLTRESRDASIETTLAAEKLEALQSMNRSSAGLAASPPDALERDTSGYCDYLDAAGLLVGADQSVFIRRWTVRPSDFDSAVLMFRVLVTTARRERMNGGLANRSAALGEVVLVGSRAD